MFAVPFEPAPAAAWYTSPKLNATSSGVGERGVEDALRAQLRRAGIEPEV